MKSPEQVLKEIRQLKEKLTPDLQKKVGNVFLGDSDKIAKAQGAKIPRGADVAEPNTKWEDDLYIKITDWLNQSDNATAKYFKSNKALFNQLAEEFPMLLQPPIGKIAYRGTSIKKDSLENAFKTKKYTVERIAGREVFHFKNLQYSPNRDAQLWTLNPKKAFSFEGSADKNDKHVPVVYITEVNKDFIFNPLLLEILWGMNEKETVRIAKAGTFEAYVDWSVSVNHWRMEPNELFIHKIKKAQPYFAGMIDAYNKAANAESKRTGEDFPLVNNIDDIISYVEMGEYPAGFDFNREYNKYFKRFIKDLKR